jgi:hypothetical protein
MDQSTDNSRIFTSKTAIIKQKSAQFGKKMKNNMFSNIL